MVKILRCAILVKTRTSCAKAPIAFGRLGGGVVGERIGAGGAVRRRIGRQRLPSHHPEVTKHGRAALRARVQGPAAPIQRFTSPGALTGLPIAAANGGALRLVGTRTPSPARHRRAAKRALGLSNCCSHSDALRSGRCRLLRSAGRNMSRFVSAPGLDALSVLQPQVIKVILATAGFQGMRRHSATRPQVALLRTDQGSHGHDDACHLSAEPARRPSRYQRPRIRHPGRRGRDGCRDARPHAHRYIRKHLPGAERGRDRRWRHRCYGALRLSRLSRVPRGMSRRLAEISAPPSACRGGR